MKYYLRIFFISITLMCSIGARAVQFTENFSSFDSNVSNLTSYGEWSNFVKASIVNNVVVTNKCLKLGITYEGGSATTPSLGIVGDAILSFTYWRGADDSYNASLTVEVSGNGSVEGNAVFIPLNNREQSTVTVVLKKLNSSSKIIFTTNNGTVSIDDIVVTSTITLNQELDNSSVLTTNQDGVVNVATVRTLREGIWNTLCLPFAVNKEVIDDALGEGCKVSTYLSYANNVMTFSPSTVDANTSIAAGTPFLIKVNTDVNNPTFKAVTITSTTPGVVTDNGVSFVGCYSSTKMATDGTELFIGTDNYMYKPEEGKNIIGGLRAFIRRNNTVGSRMSVNIDEKSLAVTAPAKMERTEPTAYTLQGVRTNAAKKGVYIVDGKKRVIR